MWLSRSAVRGGKKSLALGGSPYSGCTEAAAAISNAAVTVTLVAGNPTAVLMNGLLQTQYAEDLHLRCSFSRLSELKQPKILFGIRKSVDNFLTGRKSK